ncbi:MAG: flippase-like domain-containing protein [Planctomycetaceae bacterium]|nr:flippase-like domain-containing protein [Planctomycetaceae bacterium]
MLLLAGIGISALCFWYSMRETTWSDLKTGFLHANYLTLPLMLAILFAFYWLKAMRWTWLLAPVRRFRTSEVFPAVMVGFAANNVLPAHLGEFVRVLYLRRQNDIPATTILSTVVLERVFDILAILGLSCIGLAFTDEMPGGFQTGAMLLGGAAGTVVVLVILYLIWTEEFIRFAARVAGLVPLVPRRLSDKVLEMLRTGAAGLLAIRNPMAVLLIAVNSIAQWVLNGLIAYIALRSFGVPVTPATALIVTGVTAFAVTIPSSPGYFGVIQAAFTTTMKSQAIPVEESLVLGASLYYHISMYIPVTGLGLWYLYRADLSLSSLWKAADNREQSLEDSAVLSQQGSQD